MLSGLLKTDKYVEFGGNKRDCHNGLLFQRETGLPRLQRGGPLGRCHQTKKPLTWLLL